MMSHSFMMRSSSPSILTSVPDHLPNSTRSPALTSSGTSLPLSSRAPGPTAMISPSCGFSLAVSGMMMPPFGLVFAFDAADDDAVVQGTEFHGLEPRFVIIVFASRRAGLLVCKDAPAKARVDAEPQ